MLIRNRSLVLSRPGGGARRLWWLQPGQSSQYFSWLDEDDLEGAVERKRADWAAIKILGVLVLFLCFSMWFYFRDKEMVSSEGTVVKTAPPSG